MPEGRRYFRHYLTDTRYVADIKGFSTPDGLPDADSSDYALIVRAPNSWDGDSAAESFMFYGLHAFGTVAAANLMNPSRFKRFDREVRAKWRQQQPKWTRWIPFYRPRFPNHFAILVYVNVGGRSLQTEVVEVLKVKPNKAVLEKIGAAAQPRDPAASPHQLPHKTLEAEQRGS